MQPKKKPTLKELMIMQGKIKPDGAKDVKPPSRPAAQKPPTPSSAPKTNWQETRDDRLKTIIEKDPELAAGILKKLFLNKNKD